jgi:hypothetical protein
MRVTGSEADAGRKVPGAGDAPRFVIRDVLPALDVPPARDGGPRPIELRLGARYLIEASTDRCAAWRHGLAAGGESRPDGGPDRFDDLGVNLDPTERVGRTFPGWTSVRP